MEKNGPSLRGVALRSGQKCASAMAVCGAYSGLSSGLMYGFYTHKIYCLASCRHWTR